MRTKLPPGFLPLVAGLFLTASFTQARFTSGSTRELAISAPVKVPPERLFQQKCAKCHGTDGHGDTSMGRIFNAPDFTDAGWWAKHSNTAELIRVITRGQKNMPAFGRKLTRAQIAGLANYVQRFKS